MFREGGSHEFLNHCPMCCCSGDAERATGKKKVKGGTCNTVHGDAVRGGGMGALDASTFGGAEWTAKRKNCPNP